MSTKTEEKIMEEYGLDIKDLAKIAKALQGISADKPEKVTKSVTTSIAKWELALCNYPDFAIKRTTAKTEQLLVIMPSCGGYYIKYNKNGQEISEPLTEESYVKFTSGMPDIKLEDDMWVKTIITGKKFYDNLKQALGCEDYITMVKKRCAPKFETIFKKWGSGTRANEIRSYKKYPKLYEQYANDQRILKDFLLNDDVTERFVNIFGLNNVRDFIEEFKLSLIRDKSGNTSYSYDTNPFGAYSLKNLLDRHIFEYKYFKNYVLYQSVRMGYGCNMGQFWQDWYDTLEMQSKMYGKIKEKYPEALPMYHQQLSYKAIINAEQINAESLKRVVENLSKYDMTIGDFVFVCPKSQQDMTEEAAQQANCLASYIQKYTDGQSEIFFMRKKDDPETSYITIEKHGYDLRQIYYACNRHVSGSDREVALEWLKRCEKIDQGKLKPENEKKKEKEIKDEKASA